MSGQLYVPKRIKAGFQARSDTYTGKLSYIVYYDDKGVLRKETSWEGWRQKDIPAEEHDNTPTEGFVLHKDVKRWRFSDHFGSKRTMIRVYDPRGMEFEITTDNLIGVLMNSDCCKRQLVGQFVYAWCGSELMLIPTCSEEYQAAVSYTALQSKKVSAKDLVPGCGYKTKKEVDLIYVGRYHWYEMKGYTEGKRTSKRCHIFARQPQTYEKGWQWERKSGLDQLAARTTEEPVAEFASIVEEFQKCIHSAAIIKWEVKPVEVSDECDASPYAHYPPNLKRNTYYTQSGGIVTEWTVSRENKWVSSEKEHELVGYTVSESCTVHIADQSIRRPQYSGGYHWYNDRRTYLTIEQVRARGLGDLYVTLNNGRRVRLNSLYGI